MTKVVEEQFGVMEVHPQIIAKTLVHRTIVILGIKSVANGRMDNVFQDQKVSSINYMCGDSLAHKTKKSEDI